MRACKKYMCLLPFFPVDSGFQACITIAMMLQSKIGGAVKSLLTLRFHSTPSTNCKTYNNGSRLQPSISTTLFI